MVTLTKVSYQMVLGEVTIRAYDHYCDKEISLTFDRNDTERLLKSLVGFEAEYQEEKKE